MISCAQIVIVTAGHTNGRDATGPGVTATVRFVVGTRTAAFAPLDDIGTQLLFRFVAAAYERRAIGLASHHPFENWGRFLPEQATAAALLDRLLPGSRYAWHRAPAPVPADPFLDERRIA